MPNLFKPLLLPLVAWVLLALLALSGAADQFGASYLDRTLTRALTTFVLARGLNGAVSVA